MLKPGSKIDDFTASAMVGGDKGSMNFRDYRGSWTVLFFYPFDFTGVCGSELVAFNAVAGELSARGCKLLGASCDSVFSHIAWSKGEIGTLSYPVIGDNTKALASRFGVLAEDRGCAYRAAFLIDPEGIVRAVLCNDLSVGRNTEEVLRLLDAFQTGQSCKANWKRG